MVEATSPSSKARHESVSRAGLVAIRSVRPVTEEIQRRAGCGEQSKHNAISAAGVQLRVLAAFRTAMYQHTGRPLQCSSWRDGNQAAHGWMPLSHLAAFDELPQRTARQRAFDELRDGCATASPSRPAYVDQQVLLARHIVEYSIPLSSVASLLPLRREDEGRLPKWEEDKGIVENEVGMTFRGKLLSLCYKV